VTDGVVTHVAPCLFGIGLSYTFVWIDALTPKVREDGRNLVARGLVPDLELQSAVR
jgi:hypothetical protein